MQLYSISYYYLKHTSALNKFIGVTPVVLKYTGLVLSYYW